MNAVHHIFRADSATYIGAPADSFESERVEWIALSEILQLVDDGRILTGTSLAALMSTLASPAR